jgi:hypothetical protein
MSTAINAPNIPPGLYATTTFQIVINLLVLLKTEGVVSENDRVDLLNTVAAGLNPGNNPQIRAMKELLWHLSGVKPS